MYKAFVVIDMGWPAIIAVSYNFEAMTIPDDKILVTGLLK